MGSFYQMTFADKDGGPLDGGMISSLACAARYAGHSLRAGLATQSYLNGAGELAIMRQTGHRSLAMVRRYIRDGSLSAKIQLPSWGCKVVT